MSLCLTHAAWASRATHGADPAPRTAFAIVRLWPVSEQITTQCRLAQESTRVPLLCPRRLPHAWLRPWRTPPGTPPPAPSAQRADFIDRGGRTILLTFSYGAPWEPDSGLGWRQHLWRNRPCCFLHFEVFTRVAGQPLPTVGAQVAVLGGHDGVYLPALGYQPQCRSESRATFWCNHAVFVWRQHGVQYAATLHFFGTGTRNLLSRLIAALAPVK